MSDHHQYTAPDGKDWRIESFAALCADYDIAPAGVVDWHRIMAGTGQAWEMVCRRYGIFSILGERDVSKMKAATEAGIAKTLGLKPADVGDMLKQAREYWKKHTRRDAKAGSGVKAAPMPAMQMDEKEVDRLCDRYGFRTSDASERAIVARRCVELASFLDNDLLRSTGVSLINQERMVEGLYETEQKIGKGEDKGSTKHLNLIEAIQKAQTKIEATQDRLGIWDTPEAMRKREKFAACMSGVVEAVRLYRSEGNREMIDGVFTEGEVEILLKHYDLRPPQYPVQLPTIVVPSAIEALFDPNFKMPKLPRHVHRRLMKGFAGGIAAARQEDGQEVQDLDLPPEDFDEN